MHYLRLYTDAAGESHFEELEMTFSSVDYAPPAPPLDVSVFTPAAAYGFLRGPAGWYGDWHPVPRRQIMFYLAGELDVEASDGEVRRIGPGSVVLVEDTTGKGHRSWVIGTTEVLIAAVQLPEE